MSVRNPRAALVALTSLSALGVLTGCAATQSTAGTSVPAAAPASHDSGSNSSDSPATAGAGGTAATSGSSFKDGSYTEQGTYSSPGGQELISVDLTIASDAVKAVTVKTVKADPTATSYEAKFIGGISGAIVGKKVDELHVTNVAGSSLTSQGFDDALTKIKSDAKA